MATIRYQIGQEKDFVLECQNYKESIFSEQYVNALRVTKYLLGESENKSLKLISFCGERGDGKTSCMLTVSNLLCECSNEGTAQNRFVKEEGFEDIVKKNFASLEVIDPSFFDDSHNVIEMVVGQMYIEYKKNTRGCDKFVLRNELLDAFQNVKRNLCVLHDKRLDAINSMQELDVLASSIGLREHFEKLVSLYLKFIGKDILLIPIDDIDLNVKQAYMMCEQIRKYLAVSKCMVLIGVKIDQLKKVVSNKFSSEIKSTNRTDKSDPIENNDECEIMAEKYVTKLLPTSLRIFMPKVYTFINSDIQIWDNDKEVMTARPLKNAVVELIFQKTRYLFYNQLGSISPIVPNNLRELFVLIGLLSVMESVKDSRSKEGKDILEPNKNIFKHYFYNIWRDRFNSNVNRQLERIINFDFGTSLNKEVIRILSENFKSILEKDYESPTPEDFEEKEKKSGIYNPPADASKTLLRSITNAGNFGYNVSVGDVFYLISSLERETLEEHQFSLLFFIKSFYSIKLYEAYDEVTEIYGNIYPKTGAEAEKLSIIDRRFDNTNNLQQLVGGGYFTYATGDLIPAFDIQPSDMRIIRGPYLNSLISEIKGEFDSIIELSKKDVSRLSEDEKSKIADFNQKLNLAEFFIMTIKCAVRAKEIASGGSVIASKINIEKTMEKLRGNVDPFIYRKYGPNTGYYLFDIMAPFANILNPRYSYCKFHAIDEDMFNKILEYPESLLRKMIESVGRDYINHGGDVEWTNLHSLLSGSVIRNADVLSSVFNNAIINRATSHDGGKEMILGFYQKIQNSHLSTQRTSDDAETYEIEFYFLEPLTEVLQKIFAKEIQTEDDDIVRRFGEIFYGLNETNPEHSKIPTFEEVKKIVGNLRRSVKISKALYKHDPLRRYTYIINQVFGEDVKNKLTYTSDEVSAKIEEFCNRLMAEISGMTIDETHSSDSSTEIAVTDNAQAGEEGETSHDER